MTSGLTLDVIGPAFYPDESYIRYFIASASRHHVPVRYYGIGYRFTHWIDTHIERCIDYLRTLHSSHVLFTDTADVLFLSDTKEILKKYSDLGEPQILFSYECSGINAGGWLAERAVIIDTLALLYEFTSGDPQERWRMAINSRSVNLVAGRQIRIVADVDRSIFQVVDGSNLRIVAVTSENGNGPAVRIYNEDTRSLPCLLHCAGGGKEERMAPFLKALGYEL